MLAVHGLNAFYGRAHILFDLELAVGRGEVVALLGRNGAGKTTTLRSLMGLVRHTGGRVTFQGRELGRLPPYAIARHGLGYVPEERRIFADLTVLENLKAGARPPRADAPAWDTARVFALFPQLEPLRDRRGGQLSGGEQQMLAIARGLMGNPALLMLDEPSEGLAPAVVGHLARSIRALKGEGLSLLLSEQNLHFARAVSDRAALLFKGRVVYEGPMAELAADEALRRDYLAV